MQGFILPKLHLLYNYVKTWEEKGEQNQNVPVWEQHCQV